MTPITEFKLEQGTYDLFAVWLAGYFDGGTHAIGGHPAIRFPTAVLGFAQSVLPQPLNPGQRGRPPVVGITMTFAPDAGNRVSRRWETIGGTRQQRYYQPVRFNFWVRCETPDDAARAECMVAAQLLDSILANSACTRPLAQCGVHQLRPGSPQPVADSTYILRLVPCAATLQYAVLSQAMI